MTLTRATMECSTEKLLYMPHTFMVTDHKQSHREKDGLSSAQRLSIPARALWYEEEKTRWEWRQKIFPDLP